jgi:hypothetical protein
MHPEGCTAQLQSIQHADHNLFCRNHPQTLSQEWS